MFFSTGYSGNVFKDCVGLIVCVTWFCVCGQKHLTTDERRRVDAVLKKMKQNTEFPKQPGTNTRTAKTKWSNLLQCLTPVAFVWRGLLLNQGDVLGEDAAGVENDNLVLLWEKCES